MNSVRYTYASSEDLPVELIFSVIITTEPVKIEIYNKSLLEKHQKVFTYFFSVSSLSCVGYPALRFPVASA